MPGMMACAFCGAEVHGNYREVIGWQRTRAGGGLNTLINRVETGRQACDACGFDLTHGVAPGTPKLFDLEGNP